MHLLTLPLYVGRAAAFVRPALQAVATRMTGAGLGEAGGAAVSQTFDTESDEYYDELTNRVKNKFPESFNQGSDQTTRSNKIAQPVASASRSATSGRKSVKLTPSQVKIANKLGVPLAEYAKYV